MRGILSFIGLWMVLICVNGSPIVKRDSAQTVITLSAGPITGIKVSSSNFKFLGIPYANPPTGNGRFAPPVPVSPACLLNPYTPDNIVFLMVEL